MSKYRISMNGKIYEMEIELVDDVTSVSHPTHNYSNVPYKNGGADSSVVQVIDPTIKSNTKINENRIESMMPGTVVRVLATSGDYVEKNQAVVVLEAMKMENEIQAPKTGVIKEILVKEGQTVPAKYLLFEME